MKLHRIVCIGATFLVSTFMVSAAQVSGRVVLKGTPPPEITIPLTADCAKFHSGPVTTHHYVVGENHGLGDVVVYIKSGLEGKQYTAPKRQEVVLDQKGCVYHPHVFAVMTNQDFEILNSDPMLHNVHALPTVPGNQEFNIAEPIKGMKLQKSFPEPEIFVKIKCDVHPWMWAYAAVLNNPFYAVTDKNGNYTLPAGLPAGTYTIEAVHVKAGKVDQKITVGASGKKTVNFTLQVPR